MKPMSTDQLTDIITNAEMLLTERGTNMRTLAENLLITLIEIRNRAAADTTPNPPGSRSASLYTTPEDAAEQARGAQRVMNQFRDLTGGGDRG